jgi:hypothetical protein
MSATPKGKRPLASKALDSAESGKASPRSHGRSNSIVEQLRDLLGSDVVLLPIKRGNKGPSGKAMYGWENFTAPKMQEPEYLARLNNGSNIGVKLGDQRATIDLDHDEAVEPFLNLNPKLRETLRSRRKRGCNFWVRIKGDYPTSCKLKTRSGEDWGEWRADGNQTVIHGIAIDRNKGETKPTAYTIINSVKPIELAFDEIRWPQELILPWSREPLSSPGVQSTDELRQLYGEPYYLHESGISLNESFWAGLFDSENIVLWEPSERAFYNYRPDTGIYEEESADAIKRRISDRLLKASRQMNCFELEKQRSDENAKCERFLHELVYPAVHPEDAVLLQKYAGMCLLGNNLIQRMLILDGESARGKTQFANVVQGIIGRENVTQLRTKFLGDRFELFRFLKKTVLVGVDVEPEFLSTKGASVLKGLVGGDWFDAEQKCGTGCFPVQGTFCALITSNSRLRVRLKGDLGAYRRRLLIVRYEAPPPEKKIPDFGALLVREEGPGILNWFVAGADMVLRDIDQSPDGDIVLTERQKGIVDSLLAESDSLRFFLRDRVERAEDADLSVSEIVEAYAEFCPDMGWNPIPITEIQHSLEGLMLELFHVAKSHSVKRDSRSVRGFFGVSLKA